MRYILRLLVVPALFALLAQPAFAQTPNQPLQFSIGAMPLEKALKEFRDLTGARIDLPSGANVDGLDSPGVKGRFSQDEALARILEGTGLTYRVNGADVFILEVATSAEHVVVSASAIDHATGPVHALRTSTPLRDTPQAVTVISRTTITDQQMQSMADVVRYVPGVGMAQGEGNRDTPIFRGNSTTADFYVDGIRDDVQYFRDLYNVDRIEAVKGPNAMIFGRGGAGGVINRTTRQANWLDGGEFDVSGNTAGNRRATGDFNHAFNSRVAARVTGVVEDSDTYRSGVFIERRGVNPTFAFAPTDRTIVRIGYEHFRDERTADRGVPSLGAAPVATDPSTFFGDPSTSIARARVNALDTTIEHQLSARVSFRNRSRIADYDKFYQNVYPSAAVNAATGRATLGAYNNATGRRNVFTQSDVNVRATTGTIGHTILIGGEFGRQATDNIRHTGYFTTIGPNATAFSVPLDAPTVRVPVEFRQSATDANNHSVAIVGAGYIQDEIRLSRYWQVVAGVRFDHFTIESLNHRTGDTFTSVDNLVSPRAGIVVKPVEPVSIYTSFTQTFLPRAGEQLSSLSVTNRVLDPERFNNYEVGVKWDVKPALSLTTALYRLDRTNVVVPDPADSTRSLLVDGQRTHGVELELSGAVTRQWTVLGGYAHQDGQLMATASPAARAGARLAQLPAHTFSLWNRFDPASRIGVGIGVTRRTPIFAATDNTVMLPAFTRVDAAAFLSLHKYVQAQINVDNLFDQRYFASAHNNNNITPGAPRAVRVSLTTRF